MGKSHFIKYDGSENETHRKAKNRLTFLLIKRGWKLFTNTVNGEFDLHPDPKHEYWYSDYYHESQTLEKRVYRLDAYMKSPEGKYYDFEFDGLYHFGSKKQMNKMNVRNTFVRAYFGRRGIPIIIMRFNHDELIGRFANDDAYILNEVDKGQDRNC